MAAVTTHMVTTKSNKAAETSYAESLLPAEAHIAAENFHAEAVPAFMMATTIRIEDELSMWRLQQPVQMLQHPTWKLHHPMQSL